MNRVSPFLIADCREAGRHLFREVAFNSPTQAERQASMRSAIATVAADARTAGFNATEINRVLAAVVEGAEFEAEGGAAMLSRPI